MSLFARIMRGPARRGLPTSLIHTCALLLLGAGLLVDRSLVSTMSVLPIGIAAAMAVVAAMVVKRFMAPTPWALIAVAVVMSAAAQLIQAEPWAGIFTMGSYLIVAAALFTGLTQLRVQIARSRSAHMPTPARWGSLIVAAAFLLSVVGLQIFARVQPAGRHAQRSELSSREGRQAAYSRPELVGRLPRPVLESSGLASSRTQKDRMWTHNDSGHQPLVYCMDSAARPCGGLVLGNAEALDWEGMSVGPGPTPGRSYLYIGDIGDNERVRRAVTVLRVPEPIGSRAERSAYLRVEPTSFRLRYPDGPHDAEALMVHPRTGDLYIVTKDAMPVVFKVRLPLRPEGVLDLRRVATLRSGEITGVTGGDIAPDGRRVVLTTYSAAFELTLTDDQRFDDIWKKSPVWVSPGLGQQQEAIAYSADGEAIWTTSEGKNAPLHEVRLR